MASQRLSKIMSQRGICSRREADRFIEQGLVQVDGRVVSTLGTRIEEHQEITLENSAKRQQQMQATVLINKPMGIVSGLPEKGYRSAITLVTRENRQYPDNRTPDLKGMAPAGRLDIDSMGLIVFTQDGRVAKQLIGPESRVEKEYLVWVRGKFDEQILDRLRHGLSLDGKKLRPAKIDHLKGSQLRFVLNEGRKRQIRRMCEQLDLQVSRLIRVRIGNLRLGKLETGKWRLLKSDESF